MDAGQTAAGCFDVAGFVDAGGDQHAVVLCAQFIERRVAAHFEVRVENNAALGQPINAAHDDVFFQLKAGDAVSQQSAHAVVPVIDVDVIASDAEIFRGRQPARASADNTDRLPARFADRDGFDPTLGPCGVGDVFLHTADGDGAVAGKFDDAIAFA